MQADADAVRGAFAALLRAQHEATPDPRLVLAAGILEGARPGRRRADDGRPLALMAELLSTGLARSPHAAARAAAEIYASPREAPTVTRRLLGKWKKVSAENRKTQ